MSQRWWKLKDKVKDRCGGRCEFCQLRRGDQLHHRRYATVGCERMQDVMLVCDLCHRVISGVLSWPFVLTCRDGSLADQGDNGKGDWKPQWIAHLEECDAREERR